MPERGGAHCRLAPTDEVLNDRIRELVRIHGLMFERLLFGERAIGPVTADLLRDVGETYLELSEALHRNRRNLPR